MGVRNGKDEARDHHANEGNVEEPRDIGDENREHLRQHHSGEIDARDGKARVAPSEVGVLRVEHVQGEESDLGGVRIRRVSAGTGSKRTQAKIGS